MSVVVCVDCRHALQGGVRNKKSSTSRKLSSSSRLDRPRNESYNTPFKRRTPQWQSNFPLAWKSSIPANQDGHPSPHSDPRKQWEPVRISSETFYKAAREHLEQWTSSLVGVERLVGIGVQPRDAKNIVGHFGAWAREQLANPSKYVFQSWFEDEYSWAMNSMADFVPALDLMITRRMISWAAGLYDYRTREGLEVWPGLDTIAKLYNAADMRHHAEAFPEARKLHRKIIMHVGPTNSGKTYNALRALAASNRGLYPRVCNLITGEEKRMLSDNAPLASCTVEMLSFITHYDVAVVDEIQMIGDRARGGAWTSAVLGLVADEVHLCGEVSAVPIVEALCEATGDELVVHNYERLSPLMAGSVSLNGDLSNLREGDCVVAFSRNTIFQLRAQVQKSTPYKVAVAYGMLPPELRAEQAKLFNEQGNEYGVMVASDAIGMGLNLKIKRVIFEKTKKWDGEKEVMLSLSTIKQIGGRAGRFELGGSVAPGIVTTLQPTGLEDVQLALRVPTRPLKRAVIEPPNDLLLSLLQILPKEARPSLAFSTLPYFARLPPHFALSNMHVKSEQARLIEECGAIGFSSSEYWTFLHAPVGGRDDLTRAGLQAFLDQYHERHQTDLRAALVKLEVYDSFVDTRDMRLTHEDPDARTKLKPPILVPGLLRKLESTHRVLIMYLWLSYRLPVTFHEHARALEIKVELEKCISFYLREMNRQPKGRSPPPPRPKLFAAAFPPGRSAQFAKPRMLTAVR
ncbi:P-loop containing nucleoside triphosphate hydrolase protein [Auriculariales sp. MPI-PUGE-AT-0066]|nr:P-loop containing nucleoside triphosphate hydrolase protein [Auriculariales sp. MPI-PUGE-AT-0066]